MKYLLVGLACLLLVGCESFGLEKESPVIMDSLCETAASATVILTVQKAQGQLSEGQITLIDQGVDLIDPICSAPTRPTTMEAIRTVERGILILQGVQGVR